MQGAYLFENIVGCDIYSHFLFESSNMSHKSWDGVKKEQDTSIIHVNCQDDYIKITFFLVLDMVGVIYIMLTFLLCIKYVRSGL